MIKEPHKTRQLYNPTLEDVVLGFDLLGSNPRHFTLKAGEAKTFPDYIADMMEEKLANKMLWENPPANKNREKRYQELLALIRVE